MSMNLSHILVAAPTFMEIQAIDALLQGLGPVRTLVTGVGPGVTAHRLTVKLMQEPDTRVVVLSGICGMYRGSALSMGDVCIASSETYGDLGRCTGTGIEPIVLPEGHDGGELHFDLLSRWACILPETELLRRSISPVPMATVSCASALFARAREVARRTAAQVENMEGAAAAQSCLSFHIPLVEIRAVSNVAGEPDRGRWEIGRALKNLSVAVASVIELLLER